MRPCI